MLLRKHDFLDCPGDCACQLALDGSSVLPAAPSIYSLELTPVCNNNCAGCSNIFAQNRPGSSLAFPQWQALLDIIAPHARTLKITGGEPTLHPQFAEIIASISQRGIPFTLFTNARWKDPDALITLMSGTPSCKGLLISLHGRDAAAHEMFTGARGSFHETVTNIQRATESHLLVAASVVLTRYNAAHLESLVEFALDLGVEQVVFNRYLGEPLPAIEPVEAELLQAIKVIEKMIAQGAPVRYGNPLPQCFAFNSSTGCAAGLAYCTIDPWGNLRPCNHSPSIAGNVFEQSLSDLWQSETMQRWRAITVAECGTCRDHGICGGGCKAMAELRHIHCDPLNKRAVIPDSPRSQFDPARRPIEVPIR